MGYGVGREMIGAVVVERWGWSGGRKDSGQGSDSLTDGRFLL